MTSGTSSETKALRTQLGVCTQLGVLLLIFSTDS